MLKSRVLDDVGWWNVEIPPRKLDHYLAPISTGAKAGAVDGLC